LRLLDLAVLAEEMGRAPLPGPFFSSSVLAALTSCTAAPRRRRGRGCRVSRRARRIGTLALLEASDRLDAAGITARCAKTRTGYRLNGTKLFVTDAHVADFIIVASAAAGRTSPAYACFLVPRDSAGVSVSPLPNIDQTRRPCAVCFATSTCRRAPRLADESRGLEGREPGARRRLRGARGR